MTWALVLGGAYTVWDDLEQLEAMTGAWPGLVVAVNDVGYAWPRALHHWVSLHPEQFPVWIAKRSDAGYPMDFETWGGTWRTGRDDSPHVDHVLPVTLVGSSGMHGVDVARYLEASRIVLCGIPMDFRPHFHSEGRPWNSPMAHRDAWLAAEEVYAGTVRSMSGWTAELLGRPDPGWLGQIAA